MANPKLQIDVEASFGPAIAGLEKFDRSIEALGKTGGKTGLSLTDLKSGIDLAISSIRGAGQGVEFLKSAFNNVVAPTLAYSDQVRDLGRSIGATAEESSKLIQAADDVFVSVGTLEAGLKAAIRKGIEPTIEGLGKLSDQYISIQDPIERTKFLMDTFGRSGADLAPLMEKGAAGIKALGDAAEKTGLVLSQNDVEATLALKEATDKLNDTMNGLKTKAALEVVPSLTQLANVISNVVDAEGLLEEAVRRGLVSKDEAAKRAWLIIFGLENEKEAVEKLTAAIEGQDAVMNAGRGIGEDRATRIREEAPATANVIKFVDILTGAYDRQIGTNLELARTQADHLTALEKEAEAYSRLIVDAGLGGEIQAAQKSYWDVIAATTPEIEKLTAQIAKYRANQGLTVTVTEDATTSANEYELATLKAAVAQQKLAEYTGDDALELAQLKVNADHAQDSVTKLGEGFGFTKEYTLDYTKKIQEANGSLDELNAKQAAAEAQLLKTSEQFVFQKISAGLDAEQTMLLAEKMGLIDPASAAAATAAMGLRAAYDAGKLSAEQFGLGADYLARAIATLTDKHVTITVDTIRHEIVYQQNVDAGPPPGEGGNGGSGTTVDTTGGGTGHFDDEGNWVPDARASGGPVTAGMPYWVGEQGPELIVPSQSGTVIPNNKLKTGPTIIQNIYTATPATDAALLQTARAVAGGWQ